jgi:hypothetical protein
LGCGYIVVPLAASMHGSRMSPWEEQGLPALASSLGRAGGRIISKPCEIMPPFEIQKFFLKIKQEYVIKKEEACGLLQELYYIIIQINSQKR